MGASYSTIECAFLSQVSRTEWLLCVNPSPLLVHRRWLDSFTSFDLGEPISLWICLINSFIGLTFNNECFCFLTTLELSVSFSFSWLKGERPGIRTLATCSQKKHAFSRFRAVREQEQKRPLNGLDKSELLWPTMPQASSAAARKKKLRVCSHVCMTVSCMASSTRKPQWHGTLLHAGKSPSVATWKRMGGWYSPGEKGTCGPCRWPPTPQLQTCLRSSSCRESVAVLRPDTFGRTFRLTGQNYRKGYSTSVPQASDGMNYTIGSFWTSTQRKSNGKKISTRVLMQTMCRLFGKEQGIGSFKMQLLSSLCEAKRPEE